MILIAAADEKWGIGKDGDLLARLPKDLDFFKSQTLDKAIVIGRKTLESFKNGNPLPKRVNVVLSRTIDYDHPRILGMSSLEDLISWSASQSEDEVFVAGGGEVYNLLAPYCSKAYITRLEGDFEADTFMPDLEGLGFKCVMEEPVISENGVKYRHTTWVKAPEV